MRVFKFQAFTQKSNDVHRATVQTIKGYKIIQAFNKYEHFIQKQVVFF